MAQEGYDSLATHLNDPHNTPILRKFGHLNILNLLYMQAELFHLERDLQAIAKEDAESCDETRQDYRYSMLDLRHSVFGADKFQWEKVLEIREKLAQYSTYGICLCMKQV